MSVLGRAFYERPATEVAPDLLGRVLVRQVDGVRVAGRIVEAEAYSGLDDLASHGRAGRTPRNLPMWEAPARAYVYLCYGRYPLLNVVCEPEGQPAAVLIRALEPLEGQAFIEARRAPHPPRHWTNGPGRLTLALAIDLTHNRHDLTRPNSALYIEAGQPIPTVQQATRPRIGLGRRVTEPWYSLPWCWYVKDNPYVSRS
jgi:DNA-3-methyladenine glycosylase